MPALSPTMTEGNLSKWLIKKGDTVKAGDLIAEIETDKATMEVEAVDEGVVLDLLFKEGEANIPVNKAIAIIGDPNEKIKVKKEAPVEKVIEEKKIVLFMKGTKDAPVCGFSKTVVSVLDHYGVDFHDVNILGHEDMRPASVSYTHLTLPTKRIV